jgi:site-specific recombinase XerD
MASLFKRADSPYWWLSWREGGRRQKASTGIRHNGARRGPSSGAAREILTAKEEELARRRFGLRGGNGKSTVDKWLNEWLAWHAATRAPAETTQIRYGHSVRGFLAWCAREGVGPLGAVDYAAAARWAGHRAGEASAKTLACDAAVLAQAWDEARARGLVDFSANPFARVRPSKLGSVSKRPLTAAEVRFLLDRINDVRPAWLRYCLFMGLYTGARITSVVLLPRAAVDFERRVIAFPQEIVKTRAYAVPLHPALADFLGDYARGLPSDQIHWCPANVVTRHLRHRKYAQHAVAAQFRRWASKGDLFAGVTFHSFRHTLPGRLLDAGVPSDVVRRILGHASGHMTEHYTHADAAAIVGEISKLHLI